jgi:hypothetical protein
MEKIQNIENIEQKLQRLREERDKAIAKKRSYQKHPDKYRLTKDGVLYIERYIERFQTSDKEIYHVDMRVKVRKPDASWRSGIIKYIRLEKGIPKIGIICSKTAEFEMDIADVRYNNRLEKIIEWADVKIPERLKKLTTPQLLREFRSQRSYLYRSGEYEIYRAELSLREHVGPTGKKEQKKKRQEKIKISGKRK